MLLRAIRTLPCLLIGLALAALPSFLGTWAWGLSAALALALLTAQQQYCRHVVPRRIRDMMHARLDPSAGPPEGAQPAPGDAIERLHRAGSDWGALRAVLAEDFQLIGGDGRRFGARMYHRSLLIMGQAFPDLYLDLEAVLADPSDPNVLYARERMLGRPRRGPVLSTTSWTRYVLEQERIREVSTTGVISVA